MIFPTVVLACFRSVFIEALLYS